MGKPTLILLAHHTPLWYWHLDAMTSPCYPSVTLLRQPTQGQWGPVVDNAARVKIASQQLADIRRTAGAAKNSPRPAVTAKSDRLFMESMKRHIMPLAHKLQA